MNNTRRKEIKRALALIEEAREILEIVCEEEQESFNNLPEGLQASEKGKLLEENITALSEFIECLEDTDTLEEM